ncbi:hypothetical protein [Agromyces larvae]|uniref:Uncharacterized protein n=1 Tax=Agromyces larvae TaxID=2929802 RepID=A0ABY4BUI7_9MICO|nr:hypothetical protein [Agromyces larvae]UOE42882.1 hypothetical protein MTO99_11860 [Agromyces larvae]
MSAVGDAIARAILDSVAVEGAPDGAIAPDDHLALIRASADAELEVRSVLRQAVESARAGGVSWSAIGAELGMTRQAAQQRFGDTTQPDASGEAGTEYRWLGPVTAFDEMPELALAGRAGWRTVEAGILRHRMLRTDTQWEHKRVIGRGPTRREEDEGWMLGCAMFPWVYLVRDLGVPAEG